MWQCFLEIVDVISKIAQTGITGFVAWLAWQTFIKEDAQESETIDLSVAPTLNVPDLKIFETTKQTTWLKKTNLGIECHIDERRVGKKGGHKWTLSPTKIKEILEDGDVYVNPGYKIRTGLLSIGNHTNWLYSKRLFPEPVDLQHKVTELLRSTGA